MRRKDREVTNPEEIKSVFEKCKVCRIGFKEEDGVYIVPVNYGYCLEEDKHTIYLHGAKEGKKIDLLLVPVVDSVTEYLVGAYVALVAGLIGRRAAVDAHQLIPDLAGERLVDHHESPLVKTADEVTAVVVVLITSQELPVAAMGIENDHTG